MLGHPKRSFRKGFQMATVIVVGLMFGVTVKYTFNVGIAVKRSLPWL